jgi:hypothetical protein
MDVLRCDVCGIEAPRWMSYDRTRDWLTLHTSGFNANFHVCSWKCLQRFANHPSMPTDLGMSELARLEKTQPTRKRGK